MTRPAPRAAPAHGAAGALGAPGEEADIRSLMAAFPTGVSIVTARTDDGRPWGMTCTSLCAVSLRPPILLVCLRCGSPTLRAVLHGRMFAVNLLHDKGQRSAEIFSSGVANRFDLIPWAAGHRAAGPHLADSAHTIADCTVVSNDVVGDHSVVMGEVYDVTSICGQPPLIRGLQKYASWEEPD
jgi:flavin reductase (NADH)